MPLTRFLAALSVALILTGCNGSSNNRDVGTAPPVVTPSAFPSQIAYVGNNVNASLRSAHGGNLSTGVQAYLISGGTTAGTVNVSLLSSSPTQSGALPEALALDPAHHYLFVVGDDDNQYLEAFQVNANGSLATSPASSVVIGSQAHENDEIAVAAPAGAPSNTEYVYLATGATGQMTAYAFNTSTQTLTAFTPGVSSADVPYSLATDTSGTHLYSGGGSGYPHVTPYVIAPATGDLTAQTQESAGTTGPIIVTNDPAASAVYAYDEGAKILYSYSTAGGILTAGNYVSTTGTAGNDIAIAPNGSALYLSDGAGGTVTGSALGSGGILETPTTTTAITGTDLLGIAVDASSKYVLTLDANTDSVLTYPIASPSTLGSPIETPLTGESPVSAVFVAQTPQG